jgi:hypothetical protein
MYSSPRAQCVITPTRFDCVPDGHEHAASKPRQLGNLGFERDDGRIVAEHVVADLGRPPSPCAFHRSAASRCRCGNRWPSEPLLVCCGAADRGRL